MMRSVDRRPAARRAGSPGGSFKKMRKVSMDTISSTSTKKRLRRIK
jgi:hypothetical protein